MAAHRYWQLYCSASAAGNFGFAELAMATSVGGTNVCGSGTPSAPTDDGVNHIAGGFDNNTTTMYGAAGGLPRWVFYDFGVGNAFDIKEMRLTARTDGNFNQSPTAGYVAFSDDGVTYYPYYNISAPAATSNGQVISYAFPAVGAFDFVRHGSSVILSNAQQTATVTSGTSAALGQRFIGGPVYFEMVIGATMSGVTRVGLANVSFSNTTQLGSDTSNLSLGYDSGGTVKINNATAATIATYAAGATIGIAWNPDTQLIWFTLNGTTWNNDVIANQNPVGNVGGISTAGLVGALSLAYSGAATSSATVHASSSTLTYTAPTGFSTPDVVAASVTVNPEAQEKHCTIYTMPATKIVLLCTKTNMNSIPAPYDAVLQSAYVTVAYTTTISATGGTGPYTYTITSGSLPPSYSMTSGGVISGTTSAIGSYTFTVQATDANGVQGSQTFTLQTFALPTGGGASNFSFSY